MQKQKLNVRMPQEIYQELAAVATDYGVSMNALAVMALRNYVGYVGNEGRLPGTYPLKRPVSTAIVSSPKPGRNAPCHCGSGKKYKQCCYPK